MGSCEASLGVSAHSGQSDWADPAVTTRYLHPDVQAMLDAGTAVSAWCPPLGVIDGGKNVG
jgi:hypothetical protein